ncbi:MAG: biotin transporter BioY [Micrococcales bacterium]|nr:biotin transporter BioY [Micrococcales bacterium]
MTENHTLHEPISSRPARVVDPRSIALVAVFAALIVVAAVLPGIPIGALGVPITLQTFAVMLAGLCLGPVRGTLAVLLYLVLGFAGLPVFSGGRSGLQVMATPSAGYLVGFVFAAFAVGYVARYVLRTQPRPRWVPLLWIGAMLTSIVFVHTLGIIGISINADVPLSTAFKGDLVFYPGDIVKNLVAAVAAAAVHRAFPDILVRPVR